MSEESVNRIMANFASRVVDACAAGQGEQLLHQFIDALARDLANSVFLKMDAVVTAAEPHQGEALWAWVRAYPNEVGIKFVDSILSTWRDWHFPEDKGEAAAKHGAKCFSAQLEQLFETSSAGGQA